jgi:hypothetical protein
MPKIPHPDDVPKFIRGTVTSASQNLNTVNPSSPITNPTTSTRTQPDPPKAEAPLRGRKPKKKGKPKYSPEQQAEHRAEIEEGRVRREVLDARNLPLEGQPAVERYIVPEEASTGKAPSTGEAHPPPASIEPPSPPAAAASSALEAQVEPEDSADSSKREDPPTLAAPPASPHHLGRGENAAFRENDDSPAPALPHITSHAPTNPEESRQYPEGEPRSGCQGHSGPTRRRFSPQRSLFERAFLPAAADIEAVGGEWVDVRREEGEEEWEKVFREYEDEE